MVINGHKSAVLEVQWTADGTQLLSCSADKTVRAWDAETGQQTKKMGEHSGVVNSVCPARRGPPLLVSGADDGAVKLWDLRDGKCRQTFVGHENDINSVDYFPDGNAFGMYRWGAGPCVVDSKTRGGARSGRLGRLVVLAV